MTSRLPLLFLLAMLLPMPAFAASDGQAAGELIAAPGFGHRGDTISLSGGKFPPRTRLTIVFACPDLTSEGPNRFSQGQQGPTTDDGGEFVGFALTVPILPGSGTVPCSIYALFGGDRDLMQLQLRTPAPFIIVPDSLLLGPEATNPSLWTSIVMGRDVPSLKLVSWPGATVELWINYPRTDTDQHAKLRLDWDGTSFLRTPQGAFVQGKGLQRVRVAWTARFQDRSYTSTTWLCVAGPSLRAASCGRG
jgi:hypothetical protein